MENEELKEQVTETGEQAAEIQPEAPTKAEDKVEGMFNKYNVIAFILQVAGILIILGYLIYCLSFVIKGTASVGEAFMYYAQTFMPSGLVILGIGEIIAVLQKIYNKK